MKTPERALTEWVSDSIQFKGGRTKRGNGNIEIVVWSRKAMTTLTEAVREYKKQTLFKDTPVTVGEVVDWNDILSIRWRARVLGINITTGWLIQFESMHEAYLYMVELHREKQEGTEQPNSAPTKPPN